jgi:hypothetical protein
MISRETVAGVTTNSREVVVAVALNSHRLQSLYLYLCLCLSPCVYPVLDGAPPGTKSRTCVPLWSGCSAGLPHPIPGGTGLDWVGADKIVQEWRVKSIL